MHTIFYIHGFLSSKNAIKAQETKLYLEKFRTDINFTSIDLPGNPKAGYELAQEYLKSLLTTSDRVSLIGSSLGGFFSMCLASKYNLKAALINPCVNPWDLIPKLLGEQINPYTKERLIITNAAIQEVKDIYAQIELKEENLALYLQRNDEVLNYEHAYKLLANAALVHVENGGTHRFENYEAVLPEIISFLEKDF
jgi:predicted esterase YcpF (UPF0227 family)